MIHNKLYIKQKAQNGQRNRTKDGEKNSTLKIILKNPEKF